MYCTNEKRKIDQRKLNSENEELFVFFTGFESVACL